MNNMKSLLYYVLYAYLFNKHNSFMRELCSASPSHRSQNRKYKWSYVRSEGCMEYGALKLGGLASNSAFLNTTL